MAKAIRILVLADTHNHIPPKVEALAAGVNEIWHLGDVCAPKLLEAMREVGPPLWVVRGNCDSNPEWPLVIDLVRNGVRFRLIHIPPNRPPENIDVVLHGHTHVPRQERVDDALFLNPGCVTRPNKGAPASAAHLTIAADGKIGWRLVPM